MADDDTEREQGVDFTPVEPVLEEITYPITVDELIAEHGDETLERTNAEPISIRALFSDMGDEIFESADDVRQGVLNVMPQESVGRKGYSDRGGSTPDEHEEAKPMDEDESF